MKLVLERLRLPLAHFELAVDAVLTGRVTALFGASGAGKTSLLEIVAGVRRPKTGRVTLDGAVLTDAASRVFVRPEARRVGYVPQDGALFPHLSVERNLLFSPAARTNAVPELTLEHVIDVLGIESLLPRAVGTLSGGEQRRVALGRALLAAPRLLLLDEPLAAIDDAMKERLLPYLQKVRDQFSIPMLYITHSPDEVMALCDDVLLLDRGVVRGHGAPTALFTVDDKRHYRLA